MSPLPPLVEYKNFTPTKEHIEEVAQWLKRRYPKYSNKQTMSWYSAFLVLEVSEITIREYVKKGFLKDLTIPSLSEFIARRDIVWEIYGRPEDNIEEEKISRLIDELNEIRSKNGKGTLEEEQELLRKKNQLFIVEEQTQKKEKKKSTKKRVRSDIKQTTFDFVDEIMKGKL